MRRESRRKTFCRTCNIGPRLFSIRLFLLYIWTVIVPSICFISQELQKKSSNSNNNSITTLQHKNRSITLEKSLRRPIEYQLVPETAAGETLSQNEGFQKTISAQKLSCTFSVHHLATNDWQNHKHSQRILHPLLRPVIVKKSK